MNKTLLKLKVAFFSGLFFSSFSGTALEAYTRSLLWMKPQTVVYPDQKTVNYLAFEGGQYPGLPGNPLPSYFESIPVTSMVPVDISGTISSVTYISLTKEEKAVFATYSKSLISTLTSEPVLSVTKSIARKQQLALVKFIPFRVNPQTGELEKVSAFTLNLVFAPSAARFSQVPSPAVTSSVLGSGSWFKIAVAQDGIYKLDYNFLQSIGMDMTTLIPANFRLYGNGGGQLPYGNSAPRTDDLAENAVFVTDNGTPGVFDPTDYVLFYGMSPHRWKPDPLNCSSFSHTVHLYADSTYYFITGDLGPGKRIQTRSSLSSAPTNTVTSFDDYSFHESDAVNLIKSGREWYGENFDIINSYAFTFTFPNIDQTAPVYVKADVVGRHSSNTLFNLSTNGCNTTITTSWTDVTYYAAIYANPASGCCNFLPSGPNVNVSVTRTTASPALGWLNYIEVKARRLLTQTGSMMAFRDLASVGPGNISQFNLANANNTYSVWDVTYPTNVVLQSATLNGNSLEFRVNNDSLREFISFNGSTFLTPFAKGAVANQNLHALPQVDYIIVVNPAFINDAQSLGAFHQTRDNLSYCVVTPQQIYNEFSSGSQDVSAIRDFVKMFYDRATSSNDLPQFLCLYGDGSYDNKNRLQNNSNFIPTYHSVNSTDPIRSYVSDDFFVQLDSTEGVWGSGDQDKPDVGVGRLSVRSTSESNAVLAKIVNYLTAPGFINYQANSTCSQTSVCSTFGDWRNMLCFIADDEDGNTHLVQTEQICDFIDTAYDNYNLDKIYLDAYVQVSTPGGNRYPDAVDALNRRIERGALIVNYIGHGGEVGLAHERIVEINQINNWDNFCNLPLFFTATCEFSRWDDPGRTSAGEYVLLNPEGGGIGLFTTVRLVFSGPNYTLNRRFFDYSLDTIAGGLYPKIGDLNRITKQSLVPDENHRNFTLLGDPALTLSYPKHRVITKTVNSVPVNLSQPDTLRALSQVTITGEIHDINGVKLTSFNGIVFPTVYDKESNIITLSNDQSSPQTNFDLQKNILFRGKASVVNGDFSFSFIVPKDISYQFGPGRISYYSHNGLEDAHGNYENIIIGGSNPNAPVDVDGPQVKLYMNDEKFVSGGLTDENPDIYVIVSDSNGLNTVGNGIGHDLVAVLDGNTSNPIVLNEYYEADLNSFKKGSIRYPLNNIAPGKHYISVKVWDVYNNSSTVAIEFNVAESQVLSLDHVLNYPNPFTSRTAFFFEHNRPCDKLDVQVQIFTVSGKLVKTIGTSVECEGFRSGAIDWDGMDDYGDRLGRGVYFYRLRVRTSEGETADVFQKLVIL